MENATSIASDRQAHDDGNIQAANATQTSAPTAGSPVAASWLEPGVIRIGEMFNRSADESNSPEFNALLLSIVETGGNTQPITVRPLSPAERNSNDPFQYALISGHRRLEACKKLQLKVLSIVRTESATSDPLLDRLLENRLRKDLSPIEFGRQIASLMSQRPDLSVRAIAKTLSCDHSLILKAKNVAALPEMIVRCFSAECDIRYNDAEKLKVALEVAPDEVLLEAERIVSDKREMKASQVVERLTQAARRDKREDVGGERFTTPLKVGGRDCGEITQLGKGDVTIRIGVPLTPKLCEDLRRQLNRFIERSVLDERPRPQKRPKPEEPVAPPSPTVNEALASSETPSTASSPA